MKVTGVQVAEQARPRSRRWGQASRASDERKRSVRP
jgi:hypothetical protein